MRILGAEWQDGYLDYHRGPRDVRVAVCAWMVIGDIPGMFIERPNSPRMVWNYVREIGFVSTLHKVRSRYGERLRNRRYLSIGMGRVLESDDSVSLPKGTPVLFVATAHPRCVERVVLPAPLVRPIDHSVLERFETPAGIYWEANMSGGLLEEALCGWLPESGLPVPEDAIHHLMERAEGVWRRSDPVGMTLLPVSRDASVRTRSSEPSHRPGGELRACLLGLGNYAKTQIIPNIPNGIRLARVHESDPTQLAQIHRFPWLADTNPHFDKAEDYDVVFIAGYHHTHAGLAIRTLEGGGYAVVEKPAVTTHEQLDRLSAALKRHPGRLFACFHMRYNPLMKHIWADLGVQRGEAIHYYCTVFEIRLPPRHWYRWPNSGSHVISNGCHWLDHFLHLNEYSVPVCYSIIPCGNGDSQIHVELENGAVMGMHLTHAGSERLGVRDHVEMRANGRTAILESGSHYLAESSSKVLRRARGNRMDAYRAMYRGICEKILRGEDGDSSDSLFISHNLALELEDARGRQMAAKKNPSRT